MSKQMGQKVDFEKLRKRRQRTQTLKRFVALGIILVLVGGVIALNAFLIDTGFTTHISDLAESFGGSGYPVSVPGGIIRDVKSMGSNLAVLNDTNLYIYNQKGKNVTNIQQMTDNTVMVPAGNRVLTYDVGSKRYSIDTRSKNVISKETEFSVQCGDMNGRGDFAIVTASKQYVAQVTVHDSKGEVRFGWASADNHIVDVALSDKGDKLVVGCINTSGGVLFSIFHVFDIGAQQEVAKVQFPGEILLDLVFQDDGTVGMLTDKEYRVMTDGGTIQQSYTLEEGDLLAVEHSGKELLILTQQKETRTQTLVLLDAALNVVAQMNPTGRVKDVALGSRYIYLLTDTQIVTLDRALTEKTHEEQRGNSEIHLIKNRLYVFSEDEIWVLGES